MTDIVTLITKRCALFVFRLITLVLGRYSKSWSHAEYANCHNDLFLTSLQRRCVRAVLSVVNKTSTFFKNLVSDSLAMSLLKMRLLWAFIYRRVNNNAWNGAASRKLRSGPSHGQCLMLTIFGGSHGPIKLDFAHKIKIGSQYHINIETQTFRKKPHGSALCCFTIMHPIHTSQLLKRVIWRGAFQFASLSALQPKTCSKQSLVVSELEKKQLRGKQFDSPRSVKEKVSRFLDSQTLDFFGSAFAQLVIRWQKCSSNGSSYIVV